jgi:MFS family permease
VSGEGRGLADNARWFVWFRVLFNCRFYYPIFTILFLDLGLTISEFAGLNVLWAATIVVAEVPSGALADQLGRRRLVVWASWLMVAEMLTLCLMPAGNRDWVLALFVLNRVLSGLAEAAASGADEALAYDSFPKAERAAQWPKVMAKLSRWTAVGFMISSISGSMLYDHEVVNGVLGKLGLGDVPKAWTMKVPLVLNLLTAVACVLVVRRMVEPSGGGGEECAAGCGREIQSALGRILDTGRWIWHSKAALWLMVIGVVFDSVIRLFLTVASNFYRLVQIEERWYGVIGVVMALLGLATAGLMERLSSRHSARFNFAWLAVAVLVGLLGAAAAVPGWGGVALVLPLMMGIRFLHFFLSHYMNAVIDSERRATALSFRGLTMNLAYGGMTLLFALQTQLITRQTGWDQDDPKVFAEALIWWPGWFVGTLAVAVVALVWRFRQLDGEVSPPRS